MKKLLIIFTVLAACRVASGQVLLSDFSSLGTQAYAPFNVTWNGGSGPVDQYTQGAGYASITAVNGGNPDGLGSFDAVLADATTSSPTSTDLTGQAYLQLTARLDSGNTNTALTFDIYDSTFTEIESATVLSSSLTLSFSTITVPLVLNVGGGAITDASYFSVAGDGISGDAVRVSLDNLATESSAPIPEPSSVLLLGIGFALLFFGRRTLSICFNHGS